MTFNKSLLILAFIFSTTLVFAQTDEGWNLALSKKGIDVYTRKPANAKMKEFKAETHLNAAPDKILTVILDAENYKNWMANVEEGQLIKKENDSTYLIHSAVGMPWPFDDRYEITRTVVLTDSLPNTIICKVTVLKENIEGFEENENDVRIVDGYGYWRLEDDGNGGTNVIYSFYADPAGNLPKGIVNMFIEESPYKTLLNLKSMVE